MVISVFIRKGMSEAVVASVPVVWAPVYLPQRMGWGLCVQTWKDSPK